MSLVISRFRDLAGVIIRDLAWKIVLKINNQDETAYVFCNTSNEKIKYVEKAARFLPTRP